MSTGVATKRCVSDESALGDENEDKSPFELCMNLTDSELVVVEDTSDRDSNAVILKTTAILTYKPSHTERPLQCNVQSLEVFSCSLSAEDDTALSIIDPMGVNIELSTHAQTQRVSGLADIKPKKPVLDVSFASLNVRVSYNDVQLFLAILNSLPKQLTSTQPSARPRNQKAPAVDRKKNKNTNIHTAVYMYIVHVLVYWRIYPFSAAKVKRLRDLGYSRVDCVSALEVNAGNFAESMVWLTQHATRESAGEISS